MIAATLRRRTQAFSSDVIGQKLTAPARSRGRSVYRADAEPRFCERGGEVLSEFPQVAVTVEGFVPLAAALLEVLGLRDGDDAGASRLENPVEFLDRLPVVSDVLQGMTADDDVDRGIRKLNLREIGNHVTVLVSIDGQVGHVRKPFEVSSGAFRSSRVRNPHRLPRREVHVLAQDSKERSRAMVGSAVQADVIRAKRVHGNRCRVPESPAGLPAHIADRIGSGPDPIGNGETAVQHASENFRGQRKRMAVYSRRRSWMKKDQEAELHLVEHRLWRRDAANEHPDNAGIILQSDC